MMLPKFVSSAAVRVRSAQLMRTMSTNPPERVPGYMYRCDFSDRHRHVLPTMNCFRLIKIKQHYPPGPVGAPPKAVWVPLKMKKSTDDDDDDDDDDDNQMRANGNDPPPKAVIASGNDCEDDRCQIWHCCEGDDEEPVGIMSFKAIIVNSTLQSTFNAKDNVLAIWDGKGRDDEDPIEEDHTEPRYQKKDGGKMFFIFQTQTRGSVLEPTEFPVKGLKIKINDVDGSATIKVKGLQVKNADGKNVRKSLGDCTVTSNDDKWSDPKPVEKKEHLLKRATTHTLFFNVPEIISIPENEPENEQIGKLEVSFFGEGSIDWIELHNKAIDATICPAC